MRSGQDLIWSPKLPPAAARFDIFFVSTDITAPGFLLSPKTLAGAEGFEPPSSVLETDSLTVELTPLFLVPSPEPRVPREIPRDSGLAARYYFTSLCGVCLRQRRQNFLNSSRSVVVFRFLVVE